MKYAIASDHGGFNLKEKIKKYLNNKGIELVDLGTDSEESVNYAFYGHKLANFILENPEYTGIGICGTGLGISYALNRHSHIRAARVTSVEDAILAKKHNNANVLVFGGRQTSIDKAKEMIEAFESTTFEGGRHKERIDSIDIK